MFRFVLRQVPTIVGILFIYAGCYKLLYPGESTFALESLEIRYPLAKMVVLIGIILELYVGIILVFRVSLRFGLSAGMALMLIFASYLCYLSTLAHPPSCGCLGLTGLFESSKHAALFGVFRNCIILWALKLSYDYYFKSAEMSHENAA